MMTTLFITIQRQEVCLQRRDLSQQIWIIFLLITNVTSGFCQLIDDFESDVLATAWIGDRDQFVIEDGALRLQAMDVGTSELFALVDWSEKLTWEVDFRLDFNPSNQNQFRLVLFASDTSMLPEEALYLDIGKTGSDDALNLILQQGSEVQLLATGTMGLVASEPDIEIRASLEDGLLTINVNEEILGSFDEDIMTMITDLNPPQLGYFGWVCSYTASRADRFYFNNVYVGEPKIDSVPPFEFHFC